MRYWYLLIRCALLVSLPQTEYSKTEESAKRSNSDGPIYGPLETEMTAKGRLHRLGGLIQMIKLWVAKRGWLLSAAMQKPTRHPTETRRWQVQHKTEGMLLHTVKVWEFLPQTPWVLRGYLEDGSLSPCHTFIFSLPQMWVIACFLQEGDFKNKKDVKVHMPHSAGKFLALCCVLLSSFSSAVSRAVPRKLPSAAGSSHHQCRKLYLQTSGLAPPGPVPGLNVIAELGPP